MVVADVETGCIVELNEQVARLLGASRTDFIGKHHTSLHPPELAEEYSRLFQRHVQEGGLVEPQEIWLQRLDGQKVAVEVAARVLECGNRRLILGIFRDLKVRQEMQRRLHQLSERLRVTLRSIGDAVITTDCQGLIDLMNPVAEHLTGWSLREAQGKPLTEVMRLVNAKTRKPCPNPVERVLREGTVCGLADHTMLVSKDGTERIISDNAAPIRDDAGRIKGVVIVFRDITSVRRLEEELARLQKLDSLGLLAGGIAHDFNNLLTVILGNIFLAKVHLEASEALKKLEEAEKAVLRAKDLTQQLLTFSKGGAPVRKLTSMRDLLWETASFALVGSQVALEYSLADDLWAAHVDPGQISQVVHNILLNARQAMPLGGTIYLSAQNVEIDKGAGLPLAPGRYVKIEIRDQGMGIPEEHLARIFDPYFSTKDEGRGLGLTISFSIVRRHGGHLAVRSQVGQGSTFTIYLPATVEEAPLSSEKPLSKGKGRILVMDDEESVREILGQILKYLGYEVELTSEGEEALSTYAQALAKGCRFDAVILDLTVPGGLGGKETIARLRELDPEVKAIVSSGYSNDPVLANYQAYGFSGLVAKPFRVEELGQVLKEALEA